MSTSEIPQASLTKDLLVGARITEYLSLGGLFNPELADHEAVCELLVDCRDVVASLTAHCRELTQQLSLAHDANGMIETRCKELESYAKRYRFLRDQPWEHHQYLAAVIVLHQSVNWDSTIDAALSQLKDATK